MVGSYKNGEEKMTVTSELSAYNLSGAFNDLPDQTVDRTKFRELAANRLPENRIEAALQTAHTLEDREDVSVLAKLVTP